MKKENDMNIINATRISNGSSNDSTIDSDVDISTEVNIDPQEMLDSVNLSTEINVDTEEISDFLNLRLLSYFKKIKIKII